MAWPNRGLKDMTSMSGLRQELPQEVFDTPGAHGARRIQSAAHRPPREGVVTYTTGTTKVVTAG